jgi:ribose transport system substrate-binding protein
MRGRLSSGVSAVPDGRTVVHLRERHRSGVGRAALAALAATLLALPTGATAAGETDEVSSNPYPETGAIPGSGVGKRIGYISLWDELPFVRRVTDSVIEQAAVAGADLVVCDSKADIGEALACARQLVSQGVQGVLNFQADETGAPDVCAAYGDLPTIAIDIRQPPCEVAFMGVDNDQAGWVQGMTMGEHLRDAYGCAYDSVVVLTANPTGEAARLRTGGARDGFVSVCGPIADDRLREFDVGGTNFGDEAMTSFLRSTPPGGRHVVLAVNDDAALGALRAARALERDHELLIGAQGADPSAWQAIACDPQWIVDVAYFPERYGRTLIPAMIDIIDGRAVPRELHTDHVAVTPSNIRELYPETPPCP